MKVFPGDIVVVTDRSLDGLYGKECFVTRSETSFHKSGGREDSIWVTSKKHNISQPVKLTGGQYRSLNYGDSNTRAEPGDIVVVTNPSFSRIYMKHCLVVSGSISISRLGSSSDYILVTYHGSEVQLKHDDYEISDQRLLRFCPDCKGTGEIQLFTSTVKCGCTTQKG